MDIELGTTFKLFQAGRSTLSPSYFLCVFTDVNVDAATTRVCVAQSSGDTLGPLLLSVTEVEGAQYQDAEVQLYAGDWQLTVYEQTSATNFNPVDAGREVWSELVRVVNPPSGAPERDPYECSATGGCTIDVTVRVDGTVVQTYTGVDPCEDRTYNIAITYS